MTPDLVLPMMESKTGPEASADEPGPVEWAKYKALQAENAELKREIEFLGYADIGIIWEKSVPSSPRSNDKRLLHVYRAGEGQLPDWLDVPAIKGS